MIHHHINQTMNNENNPSYHCQVVGSYCFVTITFTIILIIIVITIFCIYNKTREPINEFLTNFIKQRSDSITHSSLKNKSNKTSRTSRTTSTSNLGTSNHTANIIQKRSDDEEQLSAPLIRNRPKSKVRNRKQDKNKRKQSFQTLNKDNKRNKMR